MFDLFLAAIFFSAGFLFLFKPKQMPSKQLPLPPGRRGWPLIGNILEIPSKDESKVYHQWSETLHTDIFYLNLAGTDVVVLDTLEAASELLERRSAIYSGRTRMPMVNELMGWDFSFGLMDYGNEWRQRRLLLNQQLHPTSMSQFHPHLLRIVHRMLTKFIDDPERDFLDTARHMVGEIVMSIGYGLHVHTNDDPYITAARDSVHILSAALTPGKYFVDLFPILKFVPAWVPGAGFKEKAKEWKEKVLKMIDIPYAATKESMKSGVFEPSFMSLSLEKMNEGLNPELYTEQRIKDVAGTIYSAGSDTSLSTIASCVLGLLNHSNVVAKAQQELDRVVKPGYLPDFHDQDSLPYVTAIVKEALRWREVAPLGVPHRLDTEDVYHGYRIPAGAMVIPNVWAILHNEKVYPDPFKFNPDRFIKDGRLDPSIPDPADACWGFGRRICPGRHLAFSTVWIVIASLLTVFDIEKSVDAQGDVVEPIDDVVSGIVSVPKSYKCSLKPRSEIIKNAIQATRD
ncbi:cytochrome P450 [Pholiota conissans]|uniref:Cytochrome P450 n=1 Tax=Pholiota conissans TaxID=109636 RepID=A0A9P6CS08_9AGAR|nr:cytochrome P450 [Pholiota conissans]